MNPVNIELALHAPSTVGHLLKRYGLRADKSLGQNFLVDANVLAQVVTAAEIEASDNVLEIGPGLGVLSRELARRARHVTCVELDTRLEPLLNETLADLNNLDIIFEDALRFDLERLEPGSLLVANLPYNVASPLIVRLLASRRFKRLVFMIQKEVAERLLARPGSKPYGALTLKVKHYGQTRLVSDVKQSAFMPAPEVKSAVLRIDLHRAVPDHVQSFKVIEAAFRHRRKTLINNLVMVGYDRQSAEEALADLHIDARARAETLSLEQFRVLADRLSRD